MAYIVSVVVPVYNVEQYLKECIDSILEQSFKDIEIILVDDGTKDDSGLICDEYSQKYSNVKTVHKKNAGLGMARNTGLKSASGKYITFVDGDDHIEKKHIQSLYEELKQNGAQACYGGYKEQIGDFYITLPNPCAGEVYRASRITKEIIPRMCGRLDYKTHDEIAMSVCMALYSLDIIRENNILFNSERELISEDLVFNLEYLRYADCICFSSSCSYLYRKNYNSLTKQYLSDRLAKQIIMTDYVIKKTKEINVFEQSEQRIYSTFLFWVRHIVKSEQRNYKNVGFIESLKRIRKVCTDPFVIEVINKYDSTLLTTNPFLLHTLIKGKSILLIWIVSFFRNKVR